LVAKGKPEANGAAVWDGMKGNGRINVPIFNFLLVAWSLHFSVCGWGWGGWMAFLPENIVPGNVPVFVPGKCEQKKNKGNEGDSYVLGVHASRPDK
jgi:hypothetical protein